MLQISQLDNAEVPIACEPTEQKLYCCPGENYPISRSVHLARLAAFYPKCRDCPLRSDTGQLARQTVERIQRTERRVERPSFFTSEGVRGVYLNEITRRWVGQAAAAFASLLWEHAPLAASVSLEQTDTVQRRLHLPPSIAIGFDERPASPDLIRGVSLSLRRTGCQVVDMGMTTKPRLWFGVDQLKCTAAVFVNGTGAPPSWTGLDFFVQGRGPLSREWTDGGSEGGERPEGGGATREPHDADAMVYSLNQLEMRLHHQPGRFTRQAGQQRVFDPGDAYLAGLRKHFHALRPLRVCVGTPSQLVASVVSRMFDRLPCELRLVDLPVRARNTPDQNDGDVNRLSQLVIDQAAHLGLLIDDDGQRCWFLDERGRLIPGADLFSLVAGQVWQDEPRYPVIVQSDTAPQLLRRLQRQGIACAQAATTQSALVLQMLRHQAVLGGVFEDRYWFRDAFPTCDAVVTLAHVLAALSCSDARCSDRMAQLASM